MQAIDNPLKASLLGIDSIGNLTISFNKPLMIENFDIIGYHTVDEIK